MSNGEFAGGGGVTRVTSLPTASAGLRGIIFYLSTSSTEYAAGYYTIAEDSVKWISTGQGQGRVFISSIIPTPGQISKTTGIDDDGDTSGTVVFEATGNTDLVRVGIRAMGSSSYKPSVVVNAYDSLGDLIPGQSKTVIFTAPDGAGPEWESYVDLDVGASSGAPYDVTIEAVHYDGARQSAIYHVVFGPVITNITFVSQNEATGSGHTNKYPLTTWSAQQSEVKSGDTVYIKVECNPSAPAMTGIYVYGQAADLVTSVINDIPTASTWVGYFALNVTNNSVSPTTRGLKIKAHKSDGVFGEDFTSTDTLLHNNIFPTVTFGTKTYPVGQSALKDDETASVTIATTNADNVRPPESSALDDSIIIDSTPNSSGGDIILHRNNISSIVLKETGNNLSIKVFRSANGRESITANTLVWIHHAFPTITISEPATRLRSGGSDGTTIQSYTITISSNQNLSAQPTLNLGHTPIGGGWAVSNVFSGATYTWTNTLRVHDNDPKGVFTWTALSVTNRALRTTSAINGNTQYELGGFVERTLSIDPALPEGVRKGQKTFSTKVINTAKLVCFNGGELNNWLYSSSDTNQNDRFTILNALDGSIAATNTGFVWLSLDADYHDNRTQPYIIRLEEIV